MEKETRAKFDALATVTETDVETLYREAYELLRAAKLASPSRRGANNQ